MTLVALLTMTTGAWADATIAKLWVGNSEEVTSEGTISGTGATEGTASVAIENGSMVITLNNFKFSGCGHNDSGIYYQSNVNGNTPLIIKLEGDNEITVPNADKSLNGIFLYGGSNDHVFTITGSGSLTVTVGDGNVSDGIYVQQANLVLASGTVTANVGSTNAEFNSLGVSVPQGTLTIDGGTLKASGSTTNASRGVNVKNNVTIKSGELEAYGYSVGIKNSADGDALAFAEGVNPALFKAGDNETSATDVTKYEGQKYVHVVCIGSAEPAVTISDDKTSAEFEMPSYDATLEYDIVRNLASNMTTTVGDGTDGYRIRLKKEGTSFVPADMTPQQMAGLIAVTDGIESKTLTNMTDYIISIYAVKDEDEPTGEAITFQSLTPGRYVAIATAVDGSIYDGETEASNIFQLYQGYEVDIPAGEYITYYKEENLYVEDEDAQLYTITDVGEETATAVELNVAAAYTPLLVKNNAAETKTILLIPTDDEADTGVTPYAGFIGTLTDTTIDASDAANDRYAFNGKQFVWVKSNIAVAANKAWLEIPKSGTPSARTLTLVFGDTTKISTADIKDYTNGVFYDLNGRKLNAVPTKKGVYILNGRKVVVK